MLDLGLLDQVSDTSLTDDKAFFLIPACMVT
jgi:hypothetical protein